MFYDDLIRGNSGRTPGPVRNAHHRGGTTGSSTRAHYIAFLTEAYHHAAIPLPLLTACTVNGCPHHAWLRASSTIISRGWIRPTTNGSSAI